MPRFMRIAAGLLALVAVWFGIWYSMMAPHVARVKASIDHHDQQLRLQVSTTNLEANKVYASGFPFQFRVAVVRPQFSMVDGAITYTVSAERLELESLNRAQGSYRVHMPNKVEAIYAKDGSPPEHYTVTVSEMPKLNLSAHDARTLCGFGTDKACEPAQTAAPIISYALGLPASITLHMVLANEARDAQFTLPAITIPIYRPIPDRLDGALQLFIGVLREALVYKTKGNEVPAR